MWAYRTDTRKPTCESPFRLTYGSEALILVEIGEPSSRVSHYDPSMNEEGLRANFDLLTERRDVALTQMANYKQKTALYFSKVMPRQFQVGDQVLRSTAISAPTQSKKLDPSWKGLYVIMHATRPGTYRLACLDGESIPNTWHATHLKRYYS